MLSHVRDLYIIHYRSFHFEKSKYFSLSNMYQIKKPFSKKYNHRKSCCSLYSRFSLQFYIIFPRDFYIFYFYYNHMHSEMFDISNNSTRYRFHFYDKSRFVLTMELFDSLFLYFYFNTSRQHYTNFFYFKINFLQQSFMTQLYINWGIFKGR